MTNTLTVLGSINVDHVISVPYFATPGETLTGKNYYIAYGGKGANQAVAAARLKHKDTQVNFIGCLGNDPISHEIKRAFIKDGINTQAITQVENETTGLAMIQVTDSGENSIVISAGANAYLDENYVEKYSSLITEADYLLMQLETPVEGIFKAAQLAKENKTKVILNPAPAKPLTDKLLSLVDIITPNETEAEILTGIKVTDQESAVKSAEVFHQKGIHTVLITLGSKGVYLSQNGQGKIIPGFRVNAVDTTAAGDTFNGAFITALLNDETIDNAILFAHAAAAISVTRKGAQPSIPSREETLEFLKKY